MNNYILDNYIWILKFNLLEISRKIHQTSPHTSGGEKLKAGHLKFLESLERFFDMTGSMKNEATWLERMQEMAIFINFLDQAIR